MPEMPPPVPVPPPAPPIPTQSITPWYLDKALWATALGLVLPFLSSLVGFPLDPTRCAAILIPIVAYVVAHKAKSGAVLVAEIKARATQAVSAPVPSTPQGAADAINSILAPK
jgi:hypothetical protein